MKLQRRSFTLIEIVLCIALLSLVGGLLTYKGKDLISKSQTNSEISKLKKTLDLTQSLALSYHADIEVKLTLEDGANLKVQITSDEEAVQEVLKPYKDMNFTHIDSIFFEGEDGQKNSAINLLFCSTGWSIPNKSLVVNNKKIFIIK